MLRLAYCPKSSLIVVAVVWTIAACSPSGTRSSMPTIAPSSTVEPVSSPLPSPTPEQPQVSEVDRYKQALNKASSAQNLSKSALSADDWNLVASRWQQAIEGLKAISASSPYGTMAKGKLTEFEQELATAQKRADEAKAAISRTSRNRLAAGEPLKVTSTVSVSKSGKVFQAAIKRRAGGTPIIDVTFNGSYTFEMIVDTGASGTVITRQMADAMNIRTIGKTKVNTASQTGVEIPLGYVDSIAVGNAVVKEVIVAIGNEALDIGLLGHDFFSDYDVTVKQDVVEFRKR